MRFQSSDRAFTLVELMVVFGAIALLAAIFLPGLSNCHCKSIRINCMNNLKQVGLAFRMWSDDNGVYPMLLKTTNFDGPSFALQQKMYVYFQAMSNELSTPKVLCCPGDDRVAATNFVNFGNTNVSYFVGLDADETMPQMFLAGDRNLMVNGIPATNGMLAINSNSVVGWTMKMHKGQGNVALADGSVQPYNSSGLQQAFRHADTNGLRLAIP